MLSCRLSERNTAQKGSAGSHNKNILSDCSGKWQYFEFHQPASMAAQSNLHLSVVREREILIIYATETGNSLDVAEQIAREAQRRLFKVRVVSTDEYPLVRLLYSHVLPAKVSILVTYLKEDLVQESTIIFVLSTTGTGQEPRAMSPLWNMLLRSDLPEDILEELSFAVFGLGDSAYEKFCWAAKKLSRRLESLGAKELCIRGEADEQHQFGFVVLSFNEKCIFASSLRRTC